RTVTVWNACTVPSPRTKTGTFCAVAVPATTGIAAAAGGGPLGPATKSCPLNFHSVAPAAAMTTTHTRAFFGLTRWFSRGCGGRDLNICVRSKVPQRKPNLLLCLHLFSRTPDRGRAGAKPARALVKPATGLLPVRRRCG